MEGLGCVEMVTYVLLVECNVRCRCSTVRLLYTLGRKCSHVGDHCICPGRGDGRDSVMGRGSEP